MVVGSVMMVSALGLFIFNEREQRRADESVAALMPQIAQAIQEEREAQVPVVQLPVPDENEQTEMKVVEIDGHDYIGFVGIPALSRELPVMADWSYPQLKLAPCRFSGSLYSDDLVIMAHNYKQHFGGMSKVRVGDTVTFTDMNAVTTQYEVVALDVLADSDVEGMTAGEYDLTLFTCTYGGKSRMTVRCDRVNESEKTDIDAEM